MARAIPVAITAVMALLASAVQANWDSEWAGTIVPGTTVGVPEPIPAAKGCRVQSGITTYSKDVCILDWHIKDESQFAGSCAVIAACAFGIEFMALLLTKYEDRAKAARKDDPDPSAARKTVEAVVRVVLGLVKYTFSGFLILCGTWVNAFWIGSALAGFAVGHILSILLSPIKGDKKGDTSGRSGWLPDPTPNRYNAEPRNKQKQKKKKKKKKKQSAPDEYDGAGGTMPGSWFAWA